MLTRRQQQQRKQAKEKEAAEIARLSKQLGRNPDGKAVRKKAKDNDLSVTYRSDVSPHKSLAGTVRDTTAVFAFEVDDHDAREAVAQQEIERKKKKNCAALQQGRTAIHYRRYGLNDIRTQGMNETFTHSTMHQVGMQMMSIKDIKALIPQRCERLTVDDIAKKRVANRIMQARKRCKITWDVLQKHFVGVQYQRDYDLRTYARSIQHSILNDKGRWLPKYIFRDRPAHLFWIEGTSQAVLYNYIPQTDANVYLVADTSLIVNYDILCNKLLFVKDMPNRCRFICENTVVYPCDIVQTTNEAHAKHNAEKIDYFAKYKENF